MNVFHTKNPVARFTSLVVSVSCLCLVNCKNEAASDKAPEADMGQEPLTASEPVRAETYYYAEQTTSYLGTDNYNYNFMRYTVDADGQVTGVFYAAPYGTDGAKGSFKGVLSADKQTLNAERSIMAEGDRYTDQIRFKCLPEAIGLGYEKANGSAATLPKVSAEQYDQLFKTYQSQLLGVGINITDRTRLYGLTALIKNMNYTKADLDKLSFMEYQLDLDNDFSTREFLLYVMDPMLCGSGGCNLYILSATGTVLSELSVTSPPIYVDALAYEESQAKKGQFKTLYVYSKGMRRVTPVDGRYPSNPSVLEVIQEEQLQAFPEQYRLVMDYLD